MFFATNFAKTQVSHVNKKYDDEDYNKLILVRKECVNNQMFRKIIYSIVTNKTFQMADTTSRVLDKRLKDFKYANQTMLWFSFSYAKSHQELLTSPKLEEYDMIKPWAEKLGKDPYIGLIDEDFPEILDYPLWPILHTFG